jgi:hypothetical protein
MPPSVWGGFEGGGVPLIAKKTLRYIKMKQNIFYTLLLYQMLLEQ